MPDFKLPDLGEGVHEGQIIRLHAAAGDFVKEDDPFMEVETDKAAVEIRAPFTGTIEKWHVNEGQLAHVGDVMVTWKKESGVRSQGSGVSGERSEGRRQESGERSQSRAVPGPIGAAGAALVEPRAPSRQPAPGIGSGGSNGAPASGRRHKPASPATRKFAREKGIDIESIDGSGPNGRVTREDVEKAAAGAVVLTGRRGETPSPQPSPAPGHGRGGRSDVDRGAAQLPRSAASSTIPPGEDSADAHGQVRRVALTQARKTIAANMALAWSTIPHVTDSDDADVTDLEAMRKGYRSPANNNRKLTMLAFVVRAVAQALTRHAEFNAAFDAEKQEIIYKRYINVAVGVHTERGLVAPVIRDADRLSVIQIADQLDAIVAKARTATFAVADTRGGTYTISNAGAFGGSHYSTPIVTPGQCAVLAVGRTRWMPWVVGSAPAGGTPALPSSHQIVPRFIMPLSHSFDHRVADGGQEIAFLQDVIGQLENPARLMF